MKDTVLYLVLPCYNEEEILETSARELLEKYNKLIGSGRISVRSRILFVNDGSKDRTWEIITELYNSNPIFAGINLSTNRGHQNAVHAGLIASCDHADAVISIDADLQQDIEAIDEMLDKYEAGCDVVYGVRNSRSTDGMIKKATALSFYGLMKLMGCKVITNHADYRLLSKRFIEALKEYDETNLFLRGLVPTIGYKSDIVYFDVKKRMAGKSKYTFSKMMRLAVDGITSFSIEPLHYITYAGIGMLLISIVFIVQTFIEYVMGKTVPGYASMYCAIWFIGASLMLALGIVGEYLGKTYMETKKRPRYHIESCLWRDNDEA